MRQYSDSQALISLKVEMRQRLGRERARRLVEPHGDHVERHSQSSALRPRGRSACRSNITMKPAPARLGPAAAQARAFALAGSIRAIPRAEDQESEGCAYGAGLASRKPTSP